MCVIPPSPFLADAKVMASLGILWVAASLIAAGHDVSVLDLEGRQDWREAVAVTINAERPDAVCVTGTSAHFPFCIEINRIVKATRPDTRTIIGGAHATMGPQSAARGGFDVVVMDDGLSGIHLALELGAPDHEETVPTRAGPITIKGVVRGPLVPTELWPLPARHLVDIRSYKYYLAGDPEKVSTIVMWTQGCPMGCLFCGGREIEFYRRYRVRPIEQVMAEMEHIRAAYGFEYVQAMDDEINIRKDWLLPFCAAMKDRKPVKGWRAFIKSELFTDEIAAAMASAGCIEVCTGVESGSDRILKTWVRKNTTYAINKAAVETARRHGVRLKAFCMVGNPGETRDDVMLTRDWIMDAKPDSFDVTVFTPYPGSPIFNVLFPEEGRAQLPSPHMEGLPLDAPLPDFARESWFYKGVPGEYKSGTSTRGIDGSPGLTSLELVALRDQIDAECKAALGHDQAQRVSPVFAAQQVYEAGMGQTPAHTIRGPVIGGTKVAGGTVAGPCGLKPLPVVRTLVGGKDDG